LRTSAALASLALSAAIAAFLANLYGYVFVGFGAGLTAALAIVALAALWDGGLLIGDTAAAAAELNGAEAGAAFERAAAADYLRAVAAAVRAHTSGLRQHCSEAAVHASARSTHLMTDWVLSTNHRRIAVLYFIFVAITSFTGLALATIIRIELAYPGQYFLTQNAERYLTLISLHGIVMVFFVVIPALFGAFGNFLLPTQLGIRDVAFPRLNSFMFWITPSGFVLLLHLILFDRAANLTYWLDYSEQRAFLRRRYSQPQAELTRLHTQLEPTMLALRLAQPSQTRAQARNFTLREAAPQLEAPSN